MIYLLSLWSLSGILFVLWNIKEIASFGFFNVIFFLILGIIVGPCIIILKTYL